MADPTAFPEANKIGEARQAATHEATPAGGIALLDPRDAARLGLGEGDLFMGMRVVLMAPIPMRRPQDG